MNTRIPAAEKTTLDVGYIRLTDAAPFIVASELDLFGRYGLSVTLHQEVSWANIRDKLATGVLDAAQMPAPLPAMSALGVSGLRTPILTGLVLSSNGNAISVSRDLAERAAARVTGTPAVSLPRAIKQICADSGTQPILGTVHAFSLHTILLRRWLAAGGVNPDEDVRTIVVPPSQMVDSLGAGVIDGFCVGEPWNTIAAAQRVGTIVALGEEIWANAPEKVLAVSVDWHDRCPATHLRLRMALLEACRWLADSAHVGQAARMLAHPAYLNIPESCLLPALTGAMDITHRVSGPLHRFYGAHVNRPERRAADRMIQACSELLGKPLDADLAASLAVQTWRPDLFDETVQALARTVDTD